MGQLPGELLEQEFGFLGSRRPGAYRRSQGKAVPKGEEDATVSGNGAGSRQTGRSLAPEEAETAAADGYPMDGDGEPAVGLFVGKLEPVGFPGFSKLRLEEGRKILRRHSLGMLHGERPQGVTHLGRSEIGSDKIFLDKLAGSQRDAGRRRRQAVGGAAAEQHQDQGQPERDNRGPP